jgi:hypothetical protein
LQRNRTAISRYITEIQSTESEKIVLVAAKHMDLIVANFPALEGHMGITRPSGGSDYNIDKIRQCEAKIAKVLENIQIEKCDELEKESGN